MAPRRPKAKFANRGEAQLALKAKAWEKTNDQVDRCCRPCHSRRNVGASHVARAASSARRHDHASRLRMRSVQRASCCATAERGHTTPAKTTVMNSRRLMGFVLGLRTTLYHRVERERCCASHKMVSKTNYGGGRSQSMNSTWSVAYRRGPRKTTTLRPSVT